MSPPYLSSQTSFTVNITVDTTGCTNIEKAFADFARAIDPALRRFRADLQRAWPPTAFDRATQASHEFAKAFSKMERDRLRAQHHHRRFEPRSLRVARAAERPEPGSKPQTRAVRNPASFARALALRTR